MKYVSVENPALCPLQEGDKITFWVAFEFGMYTGTVVESGRFCLRVDIDGVHRYIKYSDLCCVELIC